LILKLHYRVNIGPSHSSVLRHMNPVHSLSSYSFMIRFIIILPFTPKILFFLLSIFNFVFFFFFNYSSLYAKFSLKISCSLFLFCCCYLRLREFTSFLYFHTVFCLFLSFIFFSACFPMLFFCTLYSATNVNAAASLCASSTLYLASSPRSLMPNVSTHSTQSLRSLIAMKIRTFSVQYVCVQSLSFWPAEGWERVSGTAILTADWRTKQDKYPPLATWHTHWVRPPAPVDSLPAWT
jgi:hypothetical protein